jgi:hypothetical protein
MSCMSTFSSLLALLVTIVFIIAPLWLTLSVIYRYHRVEWAVVKYTAMLRAVMAYLERRQRPDLPPAPLEAASPKSSSRLFNKLLTFFRRTLPADQLSDLKLRDEFEDYLAIIRHGPSERVRYISLKRKNLTMQQSVVADVEFCRTYTEVLPYMGILGTVVGFLFSPAVFLPGAPASVTIGGLVVALSSTAAALGCVLILKLGYENRIIPKTIEFDQSLEVIDDYARRFGDLEAGWEGEASTL